MKITFVLSCLLLSGCAAFQNPITETKITNQPMLSISWSPTSAKFDNIEPQSYLRAWVDTPEEHARIIKELLSKPKGRRAFLGNGIGIFDRDKKDNCQNLSANQNFICPWFDNGFKALMLWSDNWLKELKANKVELDYWLFDNESGDLSNWLICPTETDNSWPMAIEKDPRFPSLKADGLSLTTLKNVCDFRNSKDYLVWNGFMAQRYQPYYEKLFSLIKSYYPNIKTSDWEKYKNTKNAPLDPNCHPQDRYSEGYALGTHHQFAFYGWTMLPQCRDPLNGLTSDYPQDAFHSLLYELNLLRDGLLAGSYPFHVAVPFYGWEPKGFYADSKWYKEAIFHVYLSGPELFLFWNPYDTNPTSNADKEKLFSEALKEVDQLVGFSDKKDFQLAMLPWDSKEIKTCMMGNKKMICRVTTETEGYWLVNGVRK